MWTGAVKLSRPTDLSVREVRDLLVRPDVVRRWLGSDASFELAPGAAVRLPDGAVDDGDFSPSSAIDGEVIDSGWVGSAFEILVRFHDDAAGGLRILITERPRGSYVRIWRGGLTTPAYRAAALQVWQRALNRLDAVVREAVRELHRTRQAIVVVHGIGEQRPGQTVRAFASAVFPDQQDRLRFVKPDYTGTLFDLRVVTVPGDWSVDRPTTDIYELYWAHLVRDTRLGQVYAWMARLLLTRGDRFNSIWRSRIRALRLSTVLVAAVAAVAVWAAGVDTVLVLLPAVVLSLPSILWTVLRVAQRRLLLGFLGDAARYLEPLPDNIGRRQEIRSEGVALLDRIHDSGRYRRVVVYGHSLGSVIAYDILTHCWARRFRSRQPTTNTTGSRSLLALEDTLNPRPGTRSRTDPDDIQRLQHEAWREYRRNGFDWLVTDFVTAGSPLAHAPALIALDRRVSFESLVRDRVYPSCPPQTASVRSPVPGMYRRAFTFTHSYPDRGGRRSRSVLIPDHAALFALTRWTNLYFGPTSLVGGDPIGGPLRENLGGWVRDVRLDNPRRGVFRFAHTRYTAGTGDEAHLACLRTALSLAHRPGLDVLVPIPTPGEADWSGAVGACGSPRSDETEES